MISNESPIHFKNVHILSSHRHRDGLLIPETDGIRKITDNFPRSLDNKQYVAERERWPAPSCPGWDLLVSHFWKEGLNNMA